MYGNSRCYRERPHRSPNTNLQPRKILSVSHALHNTPETIVATVSSLGHEFDTCRWLLQIITDDKDTRSWNLQPELIKGNQTDVDSRMSR